ncbi:MAG: AAA family ATPase [Magnetococcales bacterium]|nr:AAA family ATPase [Magnetococcales bacterium]
MIKKIEFINWKSLANATLHIDPLTILIGANASGKSNVLDALLFLQRIASGISLTQALEGNASLPAIRGGLDWAALKGKVDFTLTVTLDEPDHNDLKVTVVASVINKYAFSVNGYPEDVAHSQLRNLFILDPIPSHMRGYSALSPSLSPDAANLAGVMAALPEAKQAELNQAIDTYLRHLPEQDLGSVRAEKVGHFGSDAMLYCEEVWGDGPPQLIDARNMSDGTLRFLAILVALLTRPAGSLLVIEEVDSGLHPSRADLLVRMLKEVGGSRGVDVLATTHNPALLDALGPGLFPCVTVAHRDPRTGHTQLTPLDQIDRLPKLLAMGSLGRLSTSGRLEKAVSGQEDD